MRPGLSRDALALQTLFLWAACGLVVKHRQMHLQQLRDVLTASWSQYGVCFVPGDATAYA